MINTIDVKVVAALLMLLLLSACSSHDWHVQAQPSHQAVASALDNQPDPALLKTLDLPTMAAMTLPMSVRPCCAFGYEQKVTVASMPVPLYRHANTVALADIGAHAFDAGSFSYQKNAPNGSRSTENNGLIYTQRGGFIDLAHVRDTADNAVALFYQIYPHLGKNHQIELPFEIGQRHIELSPFDVSHLDAEQRWQLAANMAVRLAYFMAEAHEIAQWHGYRSFAPWSEAVSAYSAEDLYSNMLGAKLALAILINNQAMTRQQFNFHMTAWLASTLEWLQPVDVDTTNRLLDVVDGRWWDKNQPLPHKFTLLLRHYELGDAQSPYLVAQHLAENTPHWDAVAALFQPQTNAHHLALSADMFGVNFDEVAKQWLFVDAKFSDSFQHIPQHIWVNGFTQDDFVSISRFNAIEDMRQLNEHLRQHPQLIGPEDALRFQPEASLND